MREHILGDGDAVIDYLALVDPETLQPVVRIERAHGGPVGGAH